MDDICLKSVIEISESLRDWCKSLKALFVSKDESVINANSNDDIETNNSSNACDGLFFTHG